MRTIMNKRPSRLLTPLFCSISVLIAGQTFAGTPTVTLNADKERGNIAESGRLGYVGGSTRVGISVDKNLQGQVDVNQIVAEDDLSATSVEGWFGYQLKDKNGATKGIKGAGVKLNHLWVERGGKYQSDTVHKAFGAYDKNADDHAKITAGYGQEQRDLFWSGHVSKGISGKNAIGTATTTHQTYEKAYDYGVGGEVGTFLEDSLTRIRGGADYEWGTDHSATEDKPTQATISAGVQQYFYDSPHSITLDVSASKKSGGSSANSTNSNARIGYQYEFGKAGTFQSNRQLKRTRVEIPGTAAIAAIPAISGKPAKYAKKALRTPYTKLVKTTMKLENETFFKLNSAKLTASAKKNINKIAAEIRRNSYTGAIRITGNTCGLGNAKYDQLLSERRAKAVKQYLIRAGLNPAHLVARGLGKNHPKYRNDPASGFKNRRVDIEYVSQRSVKKKAYKTSYKNVLISAATSGRPGRAGVAATPARFIWKTEEIKSAPLWVKRALHNPIRHKRSVDTYQTQTTLNVVNVVDDTYTLTSRNGLLDVLANDSADSTDLTIVTNPTHGTVEIINGKIKYTANADFAGGTDQFTYQVKGTDGNIHTATVTVTVPTAQNGAPIGVDDSYTATKNDSSLTFDVLSNDNDPENDTLSISDVSSTTSQGGTATISANKITYTPKADFVGEDTFTYTIIDDQGNEDTATVTVTISDTVATPVLSPNYAATYGNTSVTIPVLEDDTAPSGSTLELTGNHTNPTHGTVSVNTSNGTVTYTPEAGYTGTDTFTYEATDNHGFTASAMVTINIKTSDNRGAADDFIEIDINNSPQPYNVISNDSSGLKICGSISGYSGDSRVDISADKTSVTYSANSYTGSTDSFDYDVCDTDGNKIDTATVHIALGGFGGGANEAPVAMTDTASVNGANSVIIDVMNNDTDADGDTLTLAGISAGGSHGQAHIENGKIVYIANTDYSGDDTITYVLTDNNGHYVEGTVTVTITSVANSAPTIDSISAININAGDYRTVDIDLTSYFHDSDQGDSVYLANAYAASGELSFDRTTIWYTPKTGEAISGTTDTIYITVSDGKDEVTSTITVNFN